jgi:hypothetical protein
LPVNLALASHEHLVIATTQALSTFDRLLAEAGFDSERPDPVLAWRVFQAFTQIPVDCAEDGLLFECGTYDFTGEPLFQLSFTRQFTHEEDGEYAGMEQLSCTIYYAPAPELQVLKTTLWSFDCPLLDEFFARVEGLTEFQIPTRRFTPIRAEIDQEEV